MSAQIAFNPFLTSNAQGSFGVQWDGYVQGQAMDDPSARFRLRGGVLAASETIPMWGGVGISETTKPNTGVNSSLGGLITRATQIAVGTGSLTGFSVFDQDHSMVSSPQSPVPLASSGMSVHLYPFGSRARIAVACDPILADLGGIPIDQLVSWDFTAQQLIPYVAAYATNVVLTATRSLVTGTYHFTYGTTSAHGVGVGNDVTFSGFTPAAYNGTFETIAGTTGSTIVVDSGLTVDPGASSVEGQLNGGGGAVPCTVLDVQIGNCMDVVFNPVTGFATWNRNGSCALIQI